MHALDLWLATTRDQAAVRAVLAAADPDPYRDAVLARDDPRLSDLAGRPELSAQPARFVGLVGRLSALPPPRQRELLTAAARRWPGDLDILLTLGLSYPEDGGARARGRVRWFQAAVAAHPGNTVAHWNLANDMQLLGDTAGATRHLREAVRLDGKFARFHFNLGNALADRGELAEAVAEHRKAVELEPANPGYRQAHNAATARADRTAPPPEVR